MQTFKQFQIEEGVNDPNIFKMVFMAGGPGSGKGYVQKRTTGGSGMVVSNTDAFLEAGMLKAGMSLDMRNLAPDKRVQQLAIRSRAKDLGKAKLKLWINGRLGIVIDGTGAKLDRIIKLKDDAEAVGYDTSMIFVNTSLEVALERNLLRPRVVPEKVVEERWKDVQKNIGKFQSMFGASNFIVVDNNKATDADLQKVWKSVRKLINKPVKNSKALGWIKSEHDRMRRD